MTLTYVHVSGIVNPTDGQERHMGCDCAGVALSSQRYRRHIPEVAGQDLT